MPLRLVKRPNLAKIKGRIEQAKEDFADWLEKEAIREHKARVANWNHQPKFYATVFKKGPIFNFGIYVENDEAGKIWMWNNYGTGVYGPNKKEIEIVPTNASFLQFQLGYVPKTTPQGSTGGPGEYSGPTVRAKKVKVKGIKPRRHDLKVRKKLIPKARKKYIQIMAKGIFGK